MVYTENAVRCPVQRQLAHARPYRRFPEEFAYGVLAMTDLLVVGAAFALAVAVWAALCDTVRIDFYLGRWPVLLLFLAAYALAGMYRVVGISPVEELRLTVLATTLAFLVLIGASFMLKESTAYSRGIAALAWLTAVIVLPVARNVLRCTCGARDWFARDVAILGAGTTGTLVARVLNGQPELGLRPAGFFDDDPNKQGEISGVPVLGGLDEVRSYVAAAGVRYGIVAMPGLPRQQLIALLRSQAGSFHRLMIVPDLFGVSSLWVEAIDLGGVLGLEIRYNLLHLTARFSKRCLDVAAVLASAVVAIPMMAVIAAAIKLTSPGPLFYGQLRVGRGGRNFIVWKFRTMTINADAVLEMHFRENPSLFAEWQRDCKLKNDPRVTRLGRFLRRSSLDELPQLWNVLGGDMSLVGPRPIVPHEAAKYGREYELYSKVRPGITGLWQISGRNNTTYPERVRFDEYYVRNWSVWLDLYILMRTVKTVCTGDGAY
jgi:Undecaprenyl-phosphate galactose phosphotransferase WbaP